MQLIKVVIKKLIMIQMWLTYMSSGLTLDALILNVRDLQAALPIILRAEQHCVDVPIFFFIFRCFPPLLLNHVDVRHEVRNKLVLVLLATNRAFLHPVALQLFHSFYHASGQI